MFLNMVTKHHFIFSASYTNKLINVDDRPGLFNLATKTMYIKIQIPCYGNKAKNYKHFENLCLSVA